MIGSMRGPAHRYLTRYRRRLVLLLASVGFGVAAVTAMFILADTLNHHLAELGRAHEAQTATVQTVFGFTGSVTAISGAFLVFNLLAQAVWQRRTDLGVLRAPGSTRRDVARLMLSEGVWLTL